MWWTVAYWQQRSAAHRTSLPSPSSKHDSHNHDQQQDSEYNHREYEGVDVEPPSNFPVNSDRAQYDIHPQGTPHAKDRGIHDEGTEKDNYIINHHDYLKTNIGSPKGTFV